MECNKVHSKIIFFLDKELPESEISLVQEHINSCSECALFVKEMQLTLGILEEEKALEVNPFFFTKVKARLENQEQETVVGRPVLARIVQPLAFSVILLLGIYGGIKLGQPLKTELAANVLSEQEMIPFLNEMDAEPIEAFLME